jgi:hypothetical protein
MRWRAALAPLRRTKLGTFLATSPLRPQFWSSSFEAATVLWFKYGHLQSVRVRQSIDGSDEAVPWYTYPAIEFLKQFDFTEKSVFEYGSGNSTVFWSRRARRVVSVEDEEEWFERLGPQLPANCTLLHESDLRRYVDVIYRYPEGFDIIVVDGPGRGFTRMKCVRAALQRLRPGGMVILDNSDWVPDTAAVLRQADLLEVDMSGFVPIGSHTQTTSLFFHRECRLQPRTGRQPLPSAGARTLNWDPPASAPEGLEADPVIACEDVVFRGVQQDEVITKSTPRGPRRFRVIIHRDRAAVKPAIAVVDVDAERVLVVLHRPAGVEDLRLEADRLRKMNWDAFREFVRRHPLRYYVLEPDEVVPSSAHAS